MSETLPAQNLNVPENGPMTAPPPTMQTQPGNVGSNHFWRNIFYLVRDIKPPNHQSWFSQFFPRISISFSSWKRKQIFYWSKTFFFTFGPMKSLFSFSTVQTEKNSWNKLGETRLVVWWFDVTNKIYIRGFTKFGIKVAWSLLFLE